MLCSYAATSAASPKRSLGHIHLNNERIDPTGELPQCRDVRQRSGGRIEAGGVGDRRHRHRVRIPKGVTMSDPIIGTFHDAETGETITRELTPEEIAALPEATNDTPEPL